MGAWTWSMRVSVRGVSCMLCGTGWLAYSSIMAVRSASRLGATLVALAVVCAPARSGGVAAAGAIPPPEQFIGFRVGADNKLARWDAILDYMKAVAAASDRVRLRELGKTSGGNPLVVLEISAPDTLKNLDRYKQLERELYFQDGAPSARERDEIFRRGKVVVVVTCGVHANEVGATQMSVELVHRLATDDSPAVKKILDNVIFLLVPSLNPDGQIMVTDWFNRNVGTPYEAGPLPFLYHPYVGHDNNRDMYMFTQKESQYTAQLLWHDWFPSVWLDEHQMGSNGARIFVMPATDPINPNVHPLIYRWNGILGQSQAAALEAAGKDGIIYNSTYTNFWEGAMAWSGWWHNQIGLLTEVASARVAAPIDQQRAARGRPPSPGDSGRVGPNSQFETGVLPAPVDITPRTEYPRPWMGGHWTLRDIVDYELIATMALLETTADRRETLLRQIYEVNRQTVEAGKVGEVAAVLIPAEHQHDVREVAHLVDRLEVGGVEVYRADAAFEAEGRKYAAGTFVIPMTQVFARYAKDLLEPQTYPDVRTGTAPNSSGEADSPYDVTAWSLGMQLGVNVDFVPTALPATVKLTRVKGLPPTPGRITGSGARFTFDYNGPDTAIAINRLLQSGAQVSFDRPSRVAVSGVSRDKMDALAKAFGLEVTAGNTAGAGTAPAGGPAPGETALHTPRIALYSPWTGGNIDEGWTRWVLEQYEFSVTRVHNGDIRAGGAARAVRRHHPAGPDGPRDSRWLQRRADSHRVSRGDRRSRPGEPSAIRRGRRHARLPGRRRGSRHRQLGDRRPRHETPAAPRSALRTRNDSEHSGRHVAAARVRHGRRQPWVLQQQPVLHAQRRDPGAAGRHRRPLSVPRRRRVGMAEGRRVHGGARRGGIGRPEPGAHRAVRTPTATSRPDTRHVPAVV